MIRTEHIKLLFPSLSPHLSSSSTCVSHCRLLAPSCSEKLLLKVLGLIVNLLHVPEVELLRGEGGGGGEGEGEGRRARGRERGRGKGRLRWRGRGIERERELHVHVHVVYMIIYSHNYYFHQEVEWFLQEHGSTLWTSLLSLLHCHTNNSVSEQVFVYMCAIHIFPRIFVSHTCI